MNINQINQRSGLYFSFFFLIFVQVHISAQAISFEKLCALDNDLQHNSGIVSLNQAQSFWTQVDNNSPNLIYEFDRDCNILRSVFIKNPIKKDWEEICSDKDNNIYIGDFGNNNNSRKDLRILVIPHEELITSDSVDASVINFSYARQIAFPPPPEEMHYDMEAMVWFDDSLHLFSKNRTDPFDGWCYHYVLPAIPGNYSLNPVDSFKTGSGSLLFYWVTGAAVDPTTRKFVLLSHDRIWLFKDFSGNRFFSGKVQEILLSHYSQKEGICVTEPNIWYITDEYNAVIRTGGDLFKLEISTSQTYDVEPIFQIDLFEYKTSSLLKIMFPGLQIGDEEMLDVFDSSGKKIKQWTIRQAISYMPLDELSRGIYIVRNRAKKLEKSFSKKFLKLR